MIEGREERSLRTGGVRTWGWGGNSLAAGSIILIFVLFLGGGGGGNREERVKGRVWGEGKKGSIKREN